jgi:hypothetical protein
MLSLDPRVGHRKAAVALMITLAFVAGCSKKSASLVPATATPANGPARTLDSKSFFDPKNNPGAISGTFIDPHKMSDSEVQFGIAPKRDSRVTYASDVIVMEQGDKAIKSTGRDGMTWTFDARAPHVNEFQEGKIIFATSRAVGRIAHLQTSGDTVTVLLAPVQITDVIDTGRFLISQDLDLGSAIIYSAPDFPAVQDVTPASKPASWQPSEDGGGWRFVPIGAELPVQSIVGVAQSLSGLTAPPPALKGLASPVNLTDYLKAGVLAGSDGSVGMFYHYGDHGVYMDASAKLILGSAHVDFVLDIFSKRISTWGMKLSGAASLVLQVQTHSDLDRFLNAHQKVAIPMDISVPIPIGGVPFALTFHESFLLSTAFSAKRSILNANGEYTLSGNVFVGWRGGSPVFNTFSAVTAKTDLGNSIEGLSVGMNSLVAGFSIRPMIGIGAFGFNTGVYVGVDFSGSVLKQSDVVLAACRGGYMKGIIDSGVGYQLSTGLVYLVNKILKAFTDYQMPDHGTLIPGPTPPPTFMDLSTQIPKDCATPKGAPS